MEQPTTGLDKEAFKALLELDEKERNIRNREGYYKAYVLSLLIPPIGIYYFFKYLLFGNGNSEDIKAGVLSLVITIVSLLLSIWLFSLAKAKFSSKRRLFCSSIRRF